MCNEIDLAKNVEKYFDKNKNLEELKNFSIKVII